MLHIKKARLEYLTKINVRFLNLHQTPASYMFKWIVIFFIKKN